MSQLRFAVALITLLVLAVPAGASASHTSSDGAQAGAVVFSRTTTVEGELKGGLFAARNGRLNQLTENPGDSEPAFSADGRTIAYARNGDLYSVRPDGSALRRVTRGAELDSAPRLSPDGRFLVFERRASKEGPADLYRVKVTGGGLKPLTSGAGDDREASFSPDGRQVVFVRHLVGAGRGNDDLFSIRPSGSNLARLTSSGGRDEFRPRYFAGGIAFSGGKNVPGSIGFADIFTMRRNGTKVQKQVAGVGSAYVEDVSSDGRTLLFRREQGLWTKRIGPLKARPLADLPDESKTNAVFSADGTEVAAFIAEEDRQSLVAIEVRTGNRDRLAEGFEVEEGEASTIGPVIAWQPRR